MLEILEFEGVPLSDRLWVCSRPQLTGEEFTEEFLIRLDNALLTLIRVNPDHPCFQKYRLKNGHFWYYSKDYLLNKHYWIPNYYRNEQPVINLYEEANSIIYNILHDMLTTKLSSMKDNENGHTQEDSERVPEHTYNS